MARSLAVALLLVACVGPPPARAGDFGEEGVRLRGAFENQLTGMLLRRYEGGQRASVNDYVRLRVDLDADLPGDVSLRSDVVGRLFVGETEVGFGELLPRRTIDAAIAADPRWAMLLDERYAFDNELYIDNAYLKIPAGPLLITLGKQPLEQGAGYAWNPTDVFTDKDVFDPTYEKPGVVALRAVIPLGEIASLDLIGAPDGRVQDWTVAGRASLRLDWLSLGAAAAWTRVKETDLEGSLDAMTAAAMAGSSPEDAVAVNESRRLMVGGQAIADIEGVRLWVEGAYNFNDLATEDDDPPPPDDWWELVGGLEYYFSFETHVMLEYYHYGRGPMPRGGTYGLNAWTGALDRELKMLGQDFLFEAIDHPVADYWTLGLTSFQSLSDASAVIMADVHWDFVQDAELWLVVAATVGQSADFLSSSSGQGWLRLKAYF